MTNGNLIFEYLKKRRGIAADPEFYARVDEWAAWWRGFFRPFHEFAENGAGGVPVRRELFRMNMAKKVCEDWASLLMTERTYVTPSDSRAARWLCGEDGVHGFMGRTRFMERANRMTEKAFALGTGAAILRLSGVRSGAGRLLGDGNTEVSVDFVDASHIVPISRRDGAITEAAFVSEVLRDGEKLVYIEIHRLGQSGYVISNELLRARDGELVPADGDGLIGEFSTGSRVPLFSILTPNVSNSVSEESGMGMSVFGDAVDCLKGVDLAFNNFCRDIKLGGKKVFLNQSLIMRDDRGVVYTPDDVAQQLFVTLGDGDIADDLMITEHNPDLRTAENADAVQHQLDYLSFRCGFGTKHYLFSETLGRAKLTATQYMGEKQDLMQNVAKHRVMAESFLRGAARAALWAAKNVLGEDLDDGCDVTVNFDDSYFIDTETERARDRAEVAAGLLAPYEYRMRWKGENEETAREKCAASAAVATDEDGE